MYNPNIHSSNHQMLISHRYSLFSLFLPVPNATLFSPRCNRHHRTWSLLSPPAQTQTRQKRKEVRPESWEKHKNTHAKSSHTDCWQAFHGHTLGPCLRAQHGSATCTSCSEWCRCVPVVQHLTGSCSYIGNHPVWMCLAAGSARTQMFHPSSFPQQIIWCTSKGFAETSSPGLLNTQPQLCLSCSSRLHVLLVCFSQSNRLAFMWNRMLNYMAIRTDSAGLDLHYIFMFIAVV